MSIMVSSSPCKDAFVLMESDLDKRFEKVILEIPILYQNYVRDIYYNRIRAERKSVRDLALKYGRPASFILAMEHKIKDKLKMVQID